MIEGVIVSNLAVIPTDKGSVMHGLKESDPGYAGFGEIYFSRVNQYSIKGWKLHKSMICNFMVPEGAVRFVIFDNRPSSGSNGIFQCVELSHSNYARVTIPPNLWVAFEGRSAGSNIVVNVASIKHDKSESDVLPLLEIPYAW